MIQLWGIGESVLVLPAIEALKMSFPKTEINLLATTRNKDVFFGNKNINKVYLVNLNPFSILSFISKNM